MNKKIKVIVIILIFVIAVFSYFIILLTPKSIISKPYTVAKVQITTTKDSKGIIVGWYASYKDGFDVVAVTSVLYNGKDVTNKIDNIALINTMSNCKCRRMLVVYSQFRYQTSEVNWSINLIFHNKPMSITLGKINIVADSLDKRIFKILNPNPIKKILMEMVTR
jgi:hypothetical protein